MSWLSCCSSSLCKSDDKSGLHAPEKIPATDEPPKSARSTRGSPSKGKAKRPSPLAKKADKGKQDGEEIDKELTASVKTFNDSLTSPLKVRRWGDAEYEIDGKRVKLCFVPSNGDQKELVVQEGGKSDEDTTDTPLTTYLQQAAAVADSLQGRSEGSPVVARVPAEKRMTFVAPSKVSDDPSVERVRSMQVACEQARLRQHAAEAYERAEVERAGMPPPPTLATSLSRRNTPTGPGLTSAGSRAPTPPPHPVVRSGSRAETPPPPKTMSVVVTSPVAGSTPMRPPPAPLAVAVPASGSFGSFNRGQHSPFGSGPRVATPPPSPGGKLVAAYQSETLLRRNTPPLGSLYKSSNPTSPTRADSPSAVVRQNDLSAGQAVWKNSPPNPPTQSRGRSPAVQAAPVVVVATVQRQQTR